MNWYRIKEQLKGSANFMADFMRLSLMDTSSDQRFGKITEEYLKLMQISTPI
jgi:hypothetical protein